MSGLVLILTLVGVLVALEAWEVRRREARKLRKLAKGYLIRRGMELHPADQAGRVPEGWR